MALPTTLKDLAALELSFNLGAAFTGAGDMVKIRISNMVLSIWQAQRWRVNPFNDTDFALVLLGPYAAHLRHVTASEGVTDELMPDTIRQLILPWLAVDNLALGTAVFPQADGEPQQVIPAPIIHPPALPTNIDDLEYSVPSDVEYGVIDADGMTSGAATANVTGSTVVTWPATTAQYTRPYFKLSDGFAYMGTELDRLPGCRFAVWFRADEVTPLYTFRGNFPVGEQLKAHLFIARNVAGMYGLLDEDGDPLDAIPFSVNECVSTIYHRITETIGWQSAYGAYIDVPAGVFVYDVWSGSPTTATIEDMAQQVSGAATGMQRWKFDTVALGISRLPRSYRIRMLSL